MSQIRKKLYKIIFGTDTKLGRLFDIILLWAILFSITVVIFESLKTLRSEYYVFFLYAEWGFTILFTIEYFTRIWISPKPFKYIFSFLGLVDLLSIVPTYISLILTGSHYLMIIRAIRLLRVFRIFKINYFTNQGELIILALKTSFRKIGVFLFAILNIVVIIGAIMYVVEGEANGFDSIPRSIYWAIVTITTVGYGDISPQTPLGQFISSIIMIMGYAIIAVPTGIVSAEITKQNYKTEELKCENCKSIIDLKDKFCANCGYMLS
ncbi:MAG: ion transporter [Bacteroidales bacterium]|jgi:voltage-gated potassium channel|nr:ion transporter [Bacteroidales bacterium]